MVRVHPPALCCKEVSPDHPSGLFLLWGNLWEVRARFSLPVRLSQPVQTYVGWTVRAESRVFDSLWYGMDIARDGTGVFPSRMLAFQLTWKKAANAAYP